MESRFDHDFAHVRTHLGSAAQRATRELRARAFTVGSDLAFDTGEFDPASATGRRLIAHELAHVVQSDQGRAHPDVIARTPHESGIEEGRFSYSTNCGWIDWGHSNPTNARGLIAVVREASQRLAREESTLASNLAATPPALVGSTECPPHYDPGEADESLTEPMVIETRARSSGAVEILIGGFGVDSADAARAAGVAELAAEYIHGMPASTGTRYSVVVSGFGDCLGSERHNAALRQQRRDAMAALLFVNLASRGADLPSGVETETFGADEFLASNAARAGRRTNRGVLVRLLPRAAPQEIGPIPPIEARPADSVTTRASLNRSLSEGEVQSVALGLFMIGSQLYEQQQAWSQWVFQSSFSEEDLPSNLIGFYRAAEGYSSEEARTLCGTWDAARSLQIFQNYTFTPNHDFQPQTLPAGGAWPAEFQSIAPADPRSGLYDVLDLLVENPFLTRHCQWVSGRPQCP